MIKNGWKLTISSTLQSTTIHFDYRKAKWQQQLYIIFSLQRSKGTCKIIKTLKENSLLCQNYEYTTSKPSRMI